MEALDAIFTRRSVRHFTSAPVSEEQLETLLQAAMFAPSAKNRQPWQFVVIRERERLDEIPRFHPFAEMVKQAQLVIVVCGDEHLQDREGYWVQDCSAATQNILLAAHALGLGAVWLGVYPNPDREENTTRLVGLPQGVRPLCMVAVGAPAGPVTPARRYKPERVHRENWTGA